MQQRQKGHLSHPSDMLRTNHSILAFIEACRETEAYRKECAERTFAKGSLLLEQGSAASRVMVMKEGIGKCYFQEENGKNYILEFFGKGQIVGELEVIRDMDCLCNIQAITQVTAYVLSVPFFKLLLQQNLTFNQLLLQELSERIVNTSRRSSFQQLYSIEHGLKRLLLLAEQHQLQISKADMASYLGITPRSLNRLLVTLQNN